MRLRVESIRKLQVTRSGDRRGWRRSLDSVREFRETLGVENGLHDGRNLRMPKSHENFPTEQRGEQKPKEPRSVDPKTAQKLGQTAIQGTKKK
jgi:hypothetical protein